MAQRFGAGTREKRVSLQGCTAVAAASAAASPDTPAGAAAGDGFGAGEAGWAAQPAVAALLLVAVTVAPATVAAGRPAGRVGDGRERASGWAVRETRTTRSSYARQLDRSGARPSSSRGGSGRRDAGDSSAVGRGGRGLGCPAKARLGGGTRAARRASRRRVQERRVVRSDDATIRPGGGGLVPGGRDRAWTTARSARAPRSTAGAHADASTTTTRARALTSVASAPSAEAARRSE